MAVMATLVFPLVSDIQAGLIMDILDTASEVLPSVGTAPS